MTKCHPRFIHPSPSYLGIFGPRDAHTHHALSHCQVGFGRKEGFFAVGDPRQFLKDNIEIKGAGELANPAPDGPRRPQPAGGARGPPRHQRRGRGHAHATPATGGATDFAGTATIIGFWPEAGQPTSPARSDGTAAGPTPGPTAGPTAGSGGRPARGRRTPGSPRKEPSWWQ